MVSISAHGLYIANADLLAITNTILITYCFIVMMNNGHVPSHGHSGLGLSRQCRRAGVSE